MILRMSVKKQKMKKPPKKPPKNRNKISKKNEETFELIDIDDEYTDGLVDALLQQSN